MSEWVGVAFNPLCPPFDSDPFSEYHVPDTMVMSKAGYLFIRKYVRSLLSAIMLLNPLHVFYIIHSPTYFLPLHPPTTSLSLPLQSLQSKDRVSLKVGQMLLLHKEEPDIHATATEGKGKTPI